MADRPRNKKGQFTTNNGAWFKNAAKSLGYAGLDLLKETMPAVTETIDINKEFVVDIANTLRTNRNKNNNKLNIKQHLNGKALDNWNDAEEYLRNAVTDLKSGQFYNKERIQRTADEFGLDDFDFDFGDDFDVSEDLNDSKFDDESVKVVVPNVNITSNINKDNPMVKAVQQQSKLLIDSENASIKRQITIAETQMKLDKDLTGVLYGGIETVNTNLSNIITFNNEHIGGYIGASLTYYEESIKYMSDISNSLKIIRGVVEKTNEPENVHALDEITTYSGALNLQGYTKVVKRQLRNAIDEDMLLGSLMSMLESDGIKALAQSPLTFIPQMILTKMVPDFLTKTFKSFDDSFKAFIPALLNKMGSWADEASTDMMSAFKGFIGSVLGIKNVGKTEINPAMYEKGVVPFDGITRKSIVEVIPGYLSKILSALTGKDELIFDSDQGKFIPRSELKNEYNRQIRRAAVSSFDAADELKSRVSAYGLESDEEDRLKERIDDLLVALSKRKKSFNPHKKDFDDDLEEILGDSASSAEINIIRSLILSLERSQIENLAGAGHINARRNVTKLLEQYEKSGNMVGMAQVNGLYDTNADYLTNNPLIKATKMYTDSGSKMVGSIFTPSDEYGKNSLNYLHDIYKTLLQGIGVWNIDPINGRLDALTAYENANNATISRYSEYSPRSVINISEAEKAKRAEQGIKNFGDVYNVTGDTEEQVEFIRNFVDKREGNLTSKQKKPNHLGKLIRYIFGTNEEKQQVVDDTIGGWKTSLKNTFTAVDESMYKIIFGTNSVGYENNTKKGLLSSMTNNFKIWLFGEKDAEGNSIGGIINKFNNYLNEKIYTPIKDAFIGKDGIITKFKQSEMYKKLIERAKNTRDKLFGIVGEDGTRSGGKFSNFANNFTSYFKGTRLSDIRYNASAGYYINNKTNEAITDPKIIEQLQNYSKDFKWDENVKAGKRIDDGVFGNLKSIGIGFRDSLKEWLFGSDTEKTKENAKGLLSDVTSYFKQGLQGFTDLIFGQSFDKDKNQVVSNKTVDNLVDEIKAKSPKAIASGIVGGGIGMLAGAGGFGILGSLFLGPMSGVVIGTATGFLSQSDKFKDWLFGKKDEDTGERIGGFISKSTQEFLKKHKGAMIGGAALGMLKGMTGIGFLPSFILGGPLTGALFGLGTSLLTKSEAFQNMIFGKDNADGTHTEGLVNKVTNKLNNDSIKKKLGFSAAGAGLGAVLGGALSSFGILGSIAFGPLSGALLGAAAGITMSASKWSDTIFGSFDKDGNRKEQSILTKMMNAITLNILEPAKIQVMEWSYNVQDWFAEHIAEPFIDSIEPLKEEVKRLKENIVGFATKVLDKLHITDLFENIADGIKTGFEKVLNLVGKVGKGAFNAITKFTGFVLSSPVKLIHFITDKIIMPKHMREGIKEARDQIFKNIKNSEFVKNINTKIIEPFRGSIMDITDFAKEKVKDLFSNIWTKILSVGTFVKDKILNSKVVDKVKDASGKVKTFFKNRIGGRDDERLENIESGNRTFVQSIGDLASLANPFSKLRRSAKYSEAGANYQDERVKAREQRKRDREAKREEHKKRIKELRDQLDSNKTAAKALGYNYDGSEKDIEKEFRKKFGKDYRNMSSIEKEQFKDSKAVNKTIFDIGGFLRDILDVLRGKNGGVKTESADKANDNNSSTDNNKSNNESATPNINPDGTVKKDSENTDDSSDNKEPNRRKSKKEREADRKAERERLKEKSWSRSASKWLKTKINKYHSTGETEFEDKEQREDDTPSAASIMMGNNDNNTDHENNTLIPYGGTKNGEFKRTMINYHTTGETEAEDKAQRKEEEDKKKQIGILDNVRNLLQIGNKDRKDHSSVWSSIFSKKGLITGGLLLLLPLLMNFIKKLPQSVKDLFANLFGGSGNSNNGNGMDYEPKEGESVGSIIVNKGKELLGIQDTNGDRTNATGDIQANSDAIEAVTVGALQTTNSLVKTGIKVTNTAKSVIGTTKAAASVLTGKAGKFQNTSIKSTVKTLMGKNNDAANYTGKYLANDDNLRIIKRFATFLDDVVEALSKALSKRFKKFASNKTFNTIVKALKAIAKTPSRLLNWLDDIVKGFGKAATVIASGHTLDVILAGYGAVTGATASETANLFNVSKENVNPTMKAASSIIKGLLNISWGWALQLGSDISVALGGPDIVKMLATLLYTLLTGADADKATALLTAQKDFDTDYAEYVKTQEYLKGNAELMVGTDGKTEIIINDQSKIKESKDSYNDRTNQTVGSKIFEGIGSVFSGTKKFFVGQIGNAEEYEKTKTQLGQLDDLLKANAIDNDTYKATKKELEDALKKYETTNGLLKNNKTTTTTSIINNAASNKPTTITPTIKPSETSAYWSTVNTKSTVPVGGVGGSIDEVSISSTKTNSILEKLTTTLSNLNEKIKTNSSNTSTSIINTAASNKLTSTTTSTNNKTSNTSANYTTNKTTTIKDTTNENDIMSPLLSSFSSYKDIVKDLQKYIKNTITNTVNKLLKSDINSTADNVNGSDQLGSIKKIIFYGSKALAMPIYVTSKAAKTINDKLTTVWKGMDDIPSFITKITNTSALTKYNYWTNSKPAGTDMASSFKKVMFYIGRGMMAPGFYLQKALDDMNSSVKKSFNGIGGSVETYVKNSGLGGGTGGSAPGIGGAEEYDMLNSYKVSSQYGQYRTIEGVTGFHRGVDLYKGVDSPVYSFTDGTVDKVVSGYAPNSGRYGSTDGQGFGNWVRVKDSAGAYHHYAHMNGVNVSEGDRVNRGDQLGIEGHTGSSTGAHLHYEVRKGGTSGDYHTNPYTYLKNYVASIIEDTVSSNNSSTTNSTSSSSSSNNSEATGLYGFTNKLSDLITNLISPFSEFSSSISTQLYKLLGMNTETASTTDDSTDIYYDNTDTDVDDTTSSSLDTIVSKPMAKSPAASTIYNFFKAKGLPDVSIAGILGNLNVESGLNSNNLQDTYNRSFGLTDDEYTSAVNNGTYGDNKFINDSAGYGLAQWTYHTRKKGLLDLVRANNKSISDFTTQLNYLYKELQDFGTLDKLKNYTDVKSASDKIMYFLAPHDQSDSAKNMRASHAKGYYDIYKNSSTSTSTSSSNTNTNDTSAYWSTNSTSTSKTTNTNNSSKDTSAYWSSIGGGIGGSNDEISVTPYISGYNKFNTSTSKIRQSINSLLNTSNNSQNSDTFNNVIDYLKKIADGIMSIVDNTDIANTKLEDIKNIESEKTEAQNNVAVVDNSSKQSNSPMFDIASNRRVNRSNKEYQTAKLIASGG